MSKLQMKKCSDVFIIYLISVFVVMCLSTNSYAQDNNRSSADINVPNLNHIFRNYEGSPKEFVPKLHNYNPSPAINTAEPKKTANTETVKSDSKKTFDAFLEVREFNKSKIQMKSLPSKSGLVLHTLNSGDIIKVKFNLQDYIRQQKAEQKDLGYWRRVKAKAIVGERDLFFFNHWKEMQTLNPYEKVKLDILVPKNQASIPVFSKPGYIDWKECSQIYDLCNAFIDTYSDVTLMDARVFEIDGLYNNKKVWNLFYKVKFSYLKSDGKAAVGQGWIPSKYAKRKIKPLSLSLYDISHSGDVKNLSLQGSKKFFVFNNNKKNPYISASRWLAATNATQLKHRTSVFDKSFAVDVVLGVNYTSLSQDFLDEDDSLAQFGANVGLGLSAPLFLDVEIEGTALVTAPLVSSTNRKSSFIYFDEWFNFTLPKAWLNAPLKFGLGGYYYLMTNNNDEFGFNRLVGFQARLKWDTKKYHIYGKFSPIGIDLDTDFTDREIAFGAGYKFKPSKGFESPYVNLDISDINYEPNEPGEAPRSLKIQKFNLNVVYPF